MVKKTICTVLFLVVMAPAAFSQSITLLGGNALNGAINGVALGGATMALKNTNDFASIRVGLGAGTLYGIGVGAYDVSQVATGQEFFISGTFNDGDNTTIIVLLDTIYGAAAGSVITSSFYLITNEPISEALRYGAGVGAWAGFGFGLFDAFVLAKRPSDFATPAGASAAAGMVTLGDRNDRLNIGLINPELYSVQEIGPNNLSTRSAMGLSLVNTTFRF